MVLPWERLRHAASLLMGMCLPLAMAHAGAPDEPTLAETMAASSRPAYNRWAHGADDDVMVSNLRVTSSLDVYIHEDDFNQPWLDGPFLTGTWDGWRGWLYDDGFSVSLTYLSDVFGNPFGGKTQAVRYNGFFQGGLLFDFDRMAGLEGASFAVIGRWRGGGPLSKAIGVNPVTAINNYVGTPEWRMVAMFYNQQWFDKRLELRVGRQIAKADFSSIPVTDIFISNTLNANIGGMLGNAPFGSGDTTWAAMLRAVPVEEVTVQLGLYNNPRGIGEVSNHGVDFGLSGDDGLMGIGEVAWKPLLGDARLPGKYYVGGYAITSPKGGGTLGSVDYATGQTGVANWGLYAAASQLVWRECEGDLDQGLSLFLTANGAPPASNMVTFFASGGAAYVGLIPGRDRDQLALGAGFYDYSADFSRHKQQATGKGGWTGQTVIELTYSYSVTPFFVVQPDVQFFANPAGNGSVANTLVLGLQVGITF